VTTAAVVCTVAASLAYCSDRRTVDHSRSVDFAVLLYDARGGLQSGGAVADDALRGSPVHGLDVTVDPSDDAPSAPEYSLLVKLLDSCPTTWSIVRYAFSVRGAAAVRVVVGDTIVSDWVRPCRCCCCCRCCLLPNNVDNIDRRVPDIHCPMQCARVQIAVATLSGNSLRQTVHTHCASVHQAAELVAALLRVAGLAESNGSLSPGL